MWTNKKYRGQNCKGQYKVFRNKRVFILSDASNPKALHRFDSFQAAKKLGWVKA